MPFLFWWSTWFGRPLSDRQLNDYLEDNKHPRHIQHALVQLGERMARQNKTQQDAAVKRWYPELVRLAADPIEEVRNTDAWIMGQDTSGAGFHEALLKMLTDPSPMVRGNAAISLVRFGDSTGRAQILGLLQPAHIAAPTAGRIVDTDKIGLSVGSRGKGRNCRREAVLLVGELVTFGIVDSDCISGLFDIADNPPERSTGSLVASGTRGATGANCSAYGGGFSAVVGLAKRSNLNGNLKLTV